jgi:SPP1 gp7 family putative phage head morphogenesis protein
MENERYWQQRNLKTQRKVAKKTEKEIDTQLVKYFQRAYKGVEPTPAALYALDKYWQMQGQLQQELQKLGDYSMALLQKRFVEQYMEVYESTSLPSKETFSTIDKKTARQMINSVWCPDGKVWSQRIWDDMQLLTETLNEELVHCVITGKKTTELKKLLRERFNVTYHAADRIARTEIAHIQTSAAQQRYKDYGIQYVEVWADKDERRCDVCGKLHKTRYPVGAQMPVPAHPNCRCTIVPVVE